MLDPKVIDRILPLLSDSLKAVLTPPIVIEKDTESSDNIFLMEDEVITPEREGLRNRKYLKRPTLDQLEVEENELYGMRNQTIFDLLKSKIQATRLGRALFPVTVKYKKL